jgi:hypothetical protein
MTIGERARRRQAYLLNLLSPVGLALTDFAGATQGFLDEYARYALLALDNPSASWDGAVVELCKTVESELGRTLGDCPGRCGAAHGGMEGREAKKADHDQALKIALTAPNAILPMLVGMRRASSVRK